MIVFLNVILGDFNTKIRKEKILKLTIEEHGQHKISNNNGNKIILFAMSKNMTKSGSYFSTHRNTKINLNFA